MEDFRQKMAAASTALDGLAQPPRQEALPSVSEPDPGLATAAPEQPSTPPWEHRRETTPCFDEGRLRFAGRHRALQNSQVDSTFLILIAAGTSWLCCTLGATGPLAKVTLYRLAPISDSGWRVRHRWGSRCS